MLVITVARKPLEGTVASNALKWGCGGINVGASRIGTSLDVPASPKKMVASTHTVSLPGLGGTSGFDPNIGRWPANLILCTDSAKGVDDQSGILHARGNVNPTKGSTSGMFWGDGRESLGVIDPGDAGAASRFFKVVGR